MDAIRKQVKLKYGAYISRSKIVQEKTVVTSQRVFLLMAYDTSQAKYLALAYIDTKGVVTV